MMRFATLIAFSAALIAGAATAAAQDAKKMIPATGVYNCPVSLMTRCRTGRCETSVPRRQMEISINFDKSSGCMRRGAGKCRDERSFKLAEKGDGYNLIFEKDAMVFRLRGNGELFGGAVAGRAAFSFVAKCARG